MYSPNVFPVEELDFVFICRARCSNYWAEESQFDDAVFSQSNYEVPTATEENTASKIAAFVTSMAAFLVETVRSSTVWIE